MMYKVIWQFVKIICIVLQLLMIAGTVMADELKTIDECTFNGDVKWQCINIGGADVRLVSRTSADRCLEITCYNDGSTPFLNFNQYEYAFCNDEIILEADFMIDSAAATYDLFVLREKNQAVHNLDLYIENGKIGQTKVTLNEWHHIKYVLNIKEKTSIAYYDYHDVPIMQNDNLLTDGSFGGVRFTIKNQTETVKLSLDNLTISTYSDRTVITDYSFHMNDGTLFDGEKNHLYAAKVKFSSPIDFSSVCKENIKVLTNSQELINYNVWTDYDDTSEVIIYFSDSLTEGSSYTIDFSRLTDVRGFGVDANSKITFDTNPEVYKIKEWKLVDQSGATKNSYDVNSGDKIKLQITVSNIFDDEAKQCKLILAEYCEGRFLGAVVNDVTIPAKIGDVILTSELLEISGDENRTLKAFLWGNTTLSPEFESLNVINIKSDETKGIFNPNFSSFQLVEENQSDSISYYVLSLGRDSNIITDSVCFVADSPYFAGLGNKYSAQSKPKFYDGELWVSETVIGAIFENVEITATKDKDGYVSVREFAENDLKLYYTQRDSAVGIISDKDYDISGDSEREKVKDIIKYISFERPTAEQLKQLARNKKHPKLLVDEDDLAELYSRDDDFSANMSKWLLIEADTIAEADLPTEAPETSGEYYGIDYEAVLRLYWAYKVTGNQEYAQRAISQALTISGWEHWYSDDFFLQTSRALMMCSYVYDLFYDELSEEEKEIIATAIIENGLKPASDHYYGRGSSDWPLRDTNWNMVCNSGVIIGALTVAEEYQSDFCYDVLEKAILSLEYVMTEYAPDGGWYEGVGYAEFMTNKFALAVEALNRICSSSFGLVDFLGFAEYAYFPFYMTATEDKFNLHDDGRGVKLSSTASMWLAKHTGNSDLYFLRESEMLKSGVYNATFLDLLWYNPDADSKTELCFDKQYSYAEMATSRDSFGNNATWLGVHGGDNSVSHGQMDIGQFELEIDGVRFASDMGQDSYSLPDYFDFGGARGEYYVNRAEGHNVYVINPDESAGQYYYASTKVETVDKKPQGVIYTVDMTPAYIGQVKNALRGYMLTDNRKVFVLQDEITPKVANDEVFWFWHTDAEIEIVSDNHIKLIKPTKTAELYFDANIEFEVSKGVSEPLDTSPECEGNQLTAYGKLNKLTVRFNTGDEKIKFRAVCVPEGYNYIASPILNIKDWTIEDGIASDKYTIKNDTISGVKYGISAKEFLDHIIADDADKIVICDGLELCDTDKVTEGAELKVVYDTYEKIYGIDFEAVNLEIEDDIIYLPHNTPAGIVELQLGTNCSYDTDVVSGMEFVTDGKTYTAELYEAYLDSDFDLYTETVKNTTSNTNLIPPGFDNLLFSTDGDFGEHLMLRGETWEGTNALHYVSDGENEATVNIQMNKYFASGISNKKIEISFSFMTEEISADFSLEGRSTLAYSVTKFSKNGFIYIFGRPVAAYQANRKYDVKLVINLENAGYMFIINEETVYEGKTKELADALAGIKYSCEVSADTAASVWLDDVKVVETY